jgi:hypothetical protein
LKTRTCPDPGFSSFAKGLSRPRLPALSTAMPAICPDQPPSLHAPAQLSLRQEMGHKAAQIKTGLKRKFKVKLTEKEEATNKKFEQMSHMTPLQYLYTNGHAENLLRHDVCFLKFHQILEENIASGQFDRECEEEKISEDLALNDVAREQKIKDMQEAVIVNAKKGGEDEMVSQVEMVQNFVAGTHVQPKLEELGMTEEAAAELAKATLAGDTDTIKEITILKPAAEKMGMDPDLACSIVKRDRKDIGLQCYELFVEKKAKKTLANVSQKTGMTRVVDGVNSQIDAMQVMKSVGMEMVMDVKNCLPGFGLRVGFESVLADVGLMAICPIPLGQVWTVAKALIKAYDNALFIREKSPLRMMMFIRLVRSGARIDDEFPGFKTWIDEVIDGTDNAKPNHKDYPVPYCVKDSCLGAWYMLGMTQFCAPLLQETVSPPTEILGHSYQSDPNFKTNWKVGGIKFEIPEVVDRKHNVLDFFKKTEQEYFKKCQETISKHEKTMQECDCCITRSLAVIERLDKQKLALEPRVAAEDQKYYDFMASKKAAEVKLAEAYGKLSQMEKDESCSITDKNSMQSNVEKCEKELRKVKEDKDKQDDKRSKISHELMEVESKAREEQSKVVFFLPIFLFHLYRQHARPFSSPSRSHRLSRSNPLSKLERSPSLG